MHPILLLTFVLVGVAIMGFLAALLAAFWSWRRPDSWGPVALATIGGLLMLPLGILILVAEVMNGLPAESRPLAVAWVAGLCFASFVWLMTFMRTFSAR